jgi:hypothetical protein
VRLCEFGEMVGMGVLVRRLLAGRGVFARVDGRLMARWQPDLPMAVGRRFGVRDMMIDRVAPRGVRPLILSRPSAVTAEVGGGGAV